MPSFLQKFRNKCQRVYPKNDGKTKITLHLLLAYPAGYEFLINIPMYSMKERKLRLANCEIDPGSEFLRVPIFQTGKVLSVATELSLVYPLFPLI